MERKNSNLSRCSHTHGRHPRRCQESLWWLELTTVSVCCQENLGISAMELIHYFLTLPAAPGCSTTRLNKVICCCCERACAENLLLYCSCLKGKLLVNSVAISLDFARRSRLKAAKVVLLTMGGIWCVWCQTVTCAVNKCLKTSSYYTTSKSAGHGTVHTKWSCDWEPLCSCS